MGTPTRLILWRLGSLTSAVACGNPAERPPNWLAKIWNSKDKREARKERMTDQGKIMKGLQKKRTVETKKKEKIGSRAKECQPALAESYSE